MFTDFVLNVTVNSVDDAPTVVNAIDDIEVDEDSASTVISISEVFQDVDGDEITKSLVSASNPELLAVSLKEMN